MKIFILKPDGIGDFILATGAIRRLAHEYGEKNLVLCVHSIVADLAATQFPQAHILALPLLAKRRVLNLFTANLLRCMPAWSWLLGRKFHAAVSLRHMRDYLTTFLFFSCRAKRLVACDNLLLRNERKTRATVESTITRLRGVKTLPYPEENTSPPWELEAHRRVLSTALNTEVPLQDIFPSLHARARSGNYWLLCPFSSMRSKDYPPGQWCQALATLPPAKLPAEILLTGSPAQRSSLEDFAARMHHAGISCARVEIFPALQDFTNVIAGAALMLTVDTAAAHIATALDRPTLILFSGLHNGMFAPWSKSARQCWLSPSPDPSRKKWHQGIPPSLVTEKILLLSTP